jgi:hypothetical protein
LAAPGVRAADRDPKNSKNFAGFRPDACVAVWQLAGA